MNTRIKKKMAKRHNIRRYKTYKLILIIKKLCENRTYTYSSLPANARVILYLNTNENGGN
jgi:hypothetical protein